MFADIGGKEYVYIYPYYFGRVGGPYMWYGSGVLIELKSRPVIKENIDQFDDTELNLMLKFKKFKIKKDKKLECADGSLVN